MDSRLFRQTVGRFVTGVTVIATESSGSVHAMTANSFTSLSLEPPLVLKYRLALVVGGDCVLRYDNEAGTGDHRHVGGVETAYAFSGYETLLRDFWTDVDAWRRRR